MGPFGAPDLGGLCEAPPTPNPSPEGEGQEEVAARKPLPLGGGVGVGPSSAPDLGGLCEASPTPDPSPEGEGQEEEEAAREPLPLGGGVGVGPSSVPNPGGLCEASPTPIPSPEGEGREEEAARKPLPLGGGVGVGPSSVPNPGGLCEASPTPDPSAEGEGRIRAALVSATAALATFSETPRLDAELLMAHALAIPRERLLLYALDAAVPDTFAPLLARRLAHEPIAYITGTRGFWTIELAVGPGVLVPRADSETLLDAAVDHFAKRPPVRILDLGTGPGTLLLAALAEWPAATGAGIDQSDVALGFARTNAATLGMAERASFVRGDWADGIDATFDLILANPPYIGTVEHLPREVAEHEPGAALFAGADGLADYRRLVPQLGALLAPGGAAILEIGATQSDAVGALLGQEGFDVALRHDLGGNPRALIATHAA